MKILRAGAAIRLDHHVQNRCRVWNAFGPFNKELEKTQEETGDVSRSALRTQRGGNGGDLKNKLGHCLTQSHEDHKGKHS
jgi:hypothetical protein